MPDTFTHIVLPSLFHRWLGLRFLVPLFLVGTVLPDYMRELLGFLLPLEYYGSIHVFHTISGAFLLSLFISAFFITEQRKQVCLSLFAGMLVHYLFDILQGYLCPGRFYLLFPLPYSFELGWLPESAWPTVFCISLLVFLSFVIFRYRQNKRI